MDEAVNSIDSTNVLAYLNMLTGGAFANATLFAMSVTPYINSSIIIQLLTVAIPPLERLAKEGEEGRKKIGAITRYVAVLLGLIQGTLYYVKLQKEEITLYNEGFAKIFAAIVIVLVFTAGTALMIWMGEQVNQYGIGNGISVLLFAGIVARLPHFCQGIARYWNMALEDEKLSKYFVLVPLLVLIFFAVVWVIVFMNDAERRIPVQYAKRQIGRKMYGGQSSHIPIKVNLSGVMPIIFAGSILSLPATINLIVNAEEGFWKSLVDFFKQDSWGYSVVNFVLIVLFAFFYTAIQYNPIEMANNLRQNNGTIPGIRPGKPTSTFISKILYKVTLIGALFLAFVALLPVIHSALTDMKGMLMNGTSIIILVGVALDTMKQVESQMMMRHYKGFLD